MRRVALLPIVSAALVLVPGSLSAVADEVETVSVPPGLSSAQKVFIDASLDPNATYQVTISGTIKDTFGTGENAPSCVFDAFYAECTSQPGVRTPRTALQIGIGSTAGVGIDARTGRPAFKADHTYTVLLRGLGGAVWLWAYPQGAQPNHTYSGSFTVRLEGPGSGARRLTVTFTFVLVGLPPRSQRLDELLEVRGAGRGGSRGAIVVPDTLTRAAAGRIVLEHNYAAVDEDTGVRLKDTRIVIKVDSFEYKRSGGANFVYVNGDVVSSSDPHCRRKREALVILRDSAGSGVSDAVQFRVDGCRHLTQTFKGKQKLLTVAIDAR